MIVPGVLALLHFFTPFSLGKNTTEDGVVLKEPKEATEDVSGIHTEVSTHIQQAHRYWNEQTGYGAIDNVTADNFGDISTRIEDTEEIIDKIENPQLRKDFDNAVRWQQVIEAKPEKEKVQQAARWTHRIYHDLDEYVNDYDEAPLFGATHFDNGSIAESDKVLEQVEKAPED